MIINGFLLQDVNFRCIVRMKHQHNHFLHTADSLLQRPVSDATKAQIAKLFESGHGAASAWHTFNIEKQLEMSPADYAIASANNSIIPSYTFFQNYFQRQFAKEFGTKSGDSQYEKLEQFVTKYNLENDGTAKIMIEKHENKVYIAGYTPLMSRVHEYCPESADIVLSDFSGNFECSGIRACVFVTPTAAGGLPLCFGFAPIQKAPILK